MSDLIGKKFGRLTVLERYSEKKKGISNGYVNANVAML